MAGARGFVAVVGARVVPEAVAPHVAAVVRGFLARGWGIGSGGARGADAFALRAVVAAGPAACARSVVFLPGAVPARAAIRAGKPAAVVLAGGGAELPAFSGGRWVPCRLGSLAAFRWQPAPIEP